ncbi:hypothetical protein RHODO2019_11055 [Rhodococcus antarcticus]|uniref:Exonuclease n=1 Tax=Rhodococcus antarcticus TaxID=2987751 RepID=A0ABY6NWH1_9NOCA|nr:hypothetical protein [Rhodococcus antarcticus]UZJ23744.1 hypothetical protein RHODO2019_11055 [Rhodococcus antarcticus]
MSDLSKELLAKPVGPVVTARSRPEEDAFTRKIEVKGNVAEVVVRGAESDVDEDAATTFLRERGEDPDLWVPTGFRSSEWTMANGETGVSTRFSFARAAHAAESVRPPLDELLAELELHIPVAERPRGDHGFIVALGDMQFGKIDGDGVEGTLARTIGCLDRAADVLKHYRSRFDIGHVHIAWLGDHIEGFVSQGGANVWRTPLTLNEQIRLTRRVMLYALRLFADAATTVTMAAVPGNHGEPQRFSGKGLTRYDDSHDTESLIAVADAVELAPEAFGHVGFFVPDTDEMTVVLDVAGTRVAHAHGHQWKPGKHFDWWKGQAFGSSQLTHADLLLAGHLHHENVDSDGRRLFVQPPAMESESTWWRHSTGTGGNPGLVVAITKDGQTSPLEVVR